MSIGAIPRGRLGLGCVTFGREIPEDACFALMDYAVEHGITLFDTAEAYGGGQARSYRREQLNVDDIREVSDEMHSSEKIIGRWLKSRGSRDRITIVTKVTRDFRRAQVRAALEASLKRLQTDHVDIYLGHLFDAETPVDETVAAFDAVRTAGLARRIGCGNYSGAQLRAALDSSRMQGLRPFEVAELPCNLLQDSPDALPVARDHGLHVLAYSPLAAGFLTGKYSPDRAAFPKGSRFDVIPGHADIYFNERNFRRVAQLQKLAKQTGVPAEELAIAWVLQALPDSTVLVGARTVAHLATALNAQRQKFDATWTTEIANWS